jgi:hypothetical protein
MCIALRDVAAPSEWTMDRNSQIDIKNFFFRHRLRRSLRARHLMRICFAAAAVLHDYTIDVGVGKFIIITKHTAALISPCCVLSCGLFSFNKLSIIGECASERACVSCDVQSSSFRSF